MYTYIKFAKKKIVSRSLRLVLLVRPSTPKGVRSRSDALRHRRIDNVNSRKCLDVPFRVANRNALYAPKFLIYFYFFGKVVQKRVKGRT